MYSKSKYQLNGLCSFYLEGNPAKNNLTGMIESKPSP